MTPTVPALRLSCVECPTAFDTDKRASLLLLVVRSLGHAAPGCLRQVFSLDSNIQLDVDLLPFDLRLQPGEVYRLRVGLTAKQPGTVDLESIRVQIDDDHHGLPTQLIPIRPSCERRLSLAVEPICVYEQGTKLLLRLTHQGDAAVEDLSLRIEPPDRVQAGKALARRAILAPGESETLEVVLTPGPVSIVVRGTVAGYPVELRREADVPASLPRDKGKRFRFLEPRGLSKDVVEIRLVEPETALPVERRRGVYPVCGKQHYRVVIRPSHPDVRSVKLRELPEQVHVLPNVRALKDRWEFEMFLPSNEVWTKPARLFYDLETTDGPRTGEIHLAIRPPMSKRWLMAGTLGAALTLQSASLFISGLFGTPPEWQEVLSRFNPLNGIGVRHFLQVLSIPVGWLLLTGADWLQYRWRS